MPVVPVNGVDLYYEDTATGDQSVLFVPGLAWGTRLFRAQVAALESRFRCVALEPRGQGRSEITKDGYELNNIAVDILGLIDHLKMRPCHLVGHSLGGSVAVRVAARQPELIRSLALLNATADADPLWDRILFRGLSYAIELFGMGRADDWLVQSMFGDTFLSNRAHIREREDARHQFLSNDRVGIARAVRGWLRSPSVMDELPNVTVPTLVIAGQEDIAVSPTRSRKLAEAIRHCRFLLLPCCGHSSPVEAAEAVNAALTQLFEESQTHQSPEPAQR